MLAHERNERRAVIKPVNVALAHRPALHVTDRSIAINAGDFLGILRGPVVTIQPASTDAHQGRLFGKAMLCGQQTANLIVGEQNSGTTSS